jgi:hypothetical protein
MPGPILELALQASFLEGIRRTLDLAGAMERIQRTSGQMNQLGSSASTTAAVRSIGQGLGISDWASGGARLRGALQTGPGMMSAGALGIPYVPPFEIGPAVDEGRLLIRALEGLRKTMETEGKAVALGHARNAGIDAYFNYVYLSASQRARLMQDQSPAGQIWNEERIRRATQLNFEMQRREQAIGDLKDVFLEKMTMKPMEKLTNFIDLFTKRLSRSPMDDLFHKFYPGARDGGSPIGANTAAVNRNTEALRDVQGVFGGGPGARNAIPRAFGPGGGYKLSEGLRGQTITWGAYSIGMG